MTNMPAWMVQAQAAAAAAAGVEGEGEGPSQREADDRYSDDTAAAPAADSRRGDANELLSTQRINNNNSGSSSSLYKRKLGESTSSSSGSGRSVFSPSCVVLLKNMVGPGEVDAALGPETQEECGKYGVVRDCIVREIPASVASCPDQERVRLFVLFARQECAVKACRDLDGRFFGGRCISASFFDEERYENNDFEPGQHEW